MGATNEVTLVESGNVMNYTYTATVSSGTVNGNVITFNLNAMFSGGTRTITNTYHPIEVKKPELEIAKTVSPTGKVQVGDTLTYVITVENKGDAAATNVVVSDNLPEGLTDIAAKLDGDVIDNYNGSVTIPNIAAGGKAILTITAKASEAGEIKNTASVKSDETPDPISSNEVVTTVEPKNPEQITVTWKDGYTDTPIKTVIVDKGIDSEDLSKLYPADPTRDGYEFTGWSEPEDDGNGNLTITAQWSELKPDLSVTKTANTDKVKAGETVEYTISVENKGKADAENVKVTDVLDSNLTFES